MYECQLVDFFSSYYWIYDALCKAGQASAFAALTVRKSNWIPWKVCRLITDWSRTFSHLETAGWKAVCTGIEFLFVRFTFSIDLRYHLERSAASRCTDILSLGALTFELVCNDRSIQLPLHPVCLLFVDRSSRLPVMLVGIVSHPLHHLVLRKTFLLCGLLCSSHSLIRSLRL